MRQQSDLHSIAVFCRVAEVKSFSAAARSFDTTTSAISKRIAALERRLGVRVLSRTTRRVSLTEAGATLYAQASRILAELAEVEDAVAGLGKKVRGTLRVSAPTILGERLAAFVAPRLLAAHAELRVEVSISDRLVNLVEEGIDCAVRVGELHDSSLVGVRIGSLDSLVCAAPSYLAARGQPETPHELTVHDCIRLSRIPSAREWRFRGEGGREFSVAVAGRLVVDSGTAIVGAVAAGVGLARLPRFLVEDALSRGALVEVLSEWRTKPAPIHIVYPSTPQVAPKLRAFVDLLHESGAFAGDVARARRRRSTR